MHTIGRKHGETKWSLISDPSTPEETQLKFLDDAFGKGSDFAEVLIFDESNALEKGVFTKEVK